MSKSVKYSFLPCVVALLTLTAFACRMSGNTRIHSRQNEQETDAVKKTVTVGAERIGDYFSLIEGKRVGILANHTSTVNGVHLVDTLIKLGIDVRTVFAPEHGFRGTADAGETVSTYIDPGTGVEVFSIYGKSKKPPVDKVTGHDVILFDIQDVGLRYYTYLSSMHYMMESCAEAGVPLIVLDRPNPNGMYVDGPVLEKKYSSFVGMHPIPTVHGMTLGELARMINGEGWLQNSLTCDLTVISCTGYDHSTRYELPIPPSPNLPNMRSVYLYSSLCFFEGTPVSVGRGTGYPFQIYGHPEMKGYPFTFTPQQSPAALDPPQKGKLCYGIDLRAGISDEDIISNGVDLSYIVDAYDALGIGEKFFQRMFMLLTGTDYVKQMIMEGKTAREIKNRWRPDVEAFRLLRKPYLLYEE